MRLETTAPIIKRGPANLVPEMRYAFFAHAHAICAPRNNPTLTKLQFEGALPAALNSREVS
jgi:hypothetical protein